MLAIALAIAAAAAFGQRTAAVCAAGAIPDTIPAIGVDIQLQHGAVFCANLQCPPQTGRCEVHARSDSARNEQIVTTTRCFAASATAVLRERTVRTLVEPTAGTTLEAVDMYTVWSLGAPPVPMVQSSSSYNCTNWIVASGGETDDGVADGLDGWLDWLFDWN